MSLSKCVKYKYHEIGSNPAVRRHFETFRRYLLNHELTKKLTVGTEARPYFYNFYTYLNHVNIDPKLHWVTLMLSELDNPEDFDESTLVITVPDIRVVEEVLAMANL